ncbi:HNH endonuclease [Amycolatopsis anabasis]|uniref:HNH endonuclease n=1 Tax=Amycolatopsis anabasis TaxID=1840409 RepID=UPI003CCE4EC8
MRRAILVEAGHWCAIPTCRQYPVDVDHIVDWVKVRRHEFDNLIALCPRSIVGLATGLCARHHPTRRLGGSVASVTPSSC